MNDNGQIALIRKELDDEGDYQLPGNAERLSSDILPSTQV